MYPAHMATAVTARSANAPHLTTPRWRATSRLEFWNFNILVLLVCDCLLVLPARSIHHHWAARSPSAVLVGERVLLSEYSGLLDSARTLLRILIAPPS